MLYYIRERVQGWIAWVIVILLIIPFALWGINEYLGGAGPLVVATVNGEEISQRSYKEAYYLQRNRMQEMLGQRYDPALFDKRMKQQALDGLINQEILFQNAQDVGYRVGEATLIRTIQNVEGFQEAGVFSNELYLRKLNVQGESAPGFEQRMARSILTRQLYSGLATTGLTTDSEIDAILRLQEQTRDIAFIKLSAAKYKNDSDASEEALQQYYDNHKDRYMSEEKVSIEYVELDVNNLGSDVKPNEDDLREFYEERRSQNTVGEERKTRHILISVEEGADEKIIEAARAKADGLYKRIIDGANFEKLAKAFSEDPGSSKSGGDIGYFGRGGLDPNYERSMYSLKEGEVGEPVLSSFGYHIIKLDAIRSQDSKPFEEVRDEILSEYRQGQAGKKFLDLSEKLTNLAYEVPDSLEDAAGAVGLEVQTTELFSRRGGQGIAANRQVVTAAFGEEVLRQGYNSEPVEIAENHIVVLRVKDHKERVQKSLDEVMIQVKVALVNAKARERVGDEGKKIIDRLKKGDSEKAVANENKMDWEKSGALKRTDRTINTPIIQQAFKIRKPGKAQSSYGGIALASGDYVVISVSNVVDGDPGKTDDAQRVTLKRNISGARGEADFNNMLTSIKSDARIVVEDEDL